MRIESPRLHLRSRWSGTGRTAALLLALLAGACTSGRAPSGDAPGEASQADENAIVQEKVRGPVELRLRLEPRDATFADRLRFTITARAEEDVEVELPPVEQFQGNFLIKDFLYHPPERTGDGKLESRQEYVIEVLTSGTYTLPPLRTTFVDLRRPDPEDAPGTPASADAPTDTISATSPEPAAEPPREYAIISDPLEFEVREMENLEALQDLRPIAGPVEPELVPTSWRRPLLYGGLALGAALLVALVIYRFLRPRPAPPPPPPLPPHEKAHRELEWLIAQDYPGRGELKEFFFHLSRIVREYIEGRFGLRAPESTTEEFLVDLARSDALDAAHESLLKDFLERADRVKFARHEPSAEEIEGSFDAARRFIEETRPGREEASHGAG